MAAALAQPGLRAAGPFKTVYFGGGSPALCDLSPLFLALRGRLAPDCEFTVELHPLDVSEDLLQTLRDGGVNRISMGVQSLDDAILADMGRGYDLKTAARAFQMIRNQFANAGIDLIVGYPGEAGNWASRVARLADWGLAHCSVYSLILEEKSLLAARIRRTPSLKLPNDETVMDWLRDVARSLGDLGLARYEISNYAKPGRECRHNLSVWRGEDYLGLGEGAAGRLGLSRTQDAGTPTEREEIVTPTADATERAIFRLRTREGLSPEGRPDWRPVLDRFADEGLLTVRGGNYRLTARGTEVCDTILAELV